MRIGRLAGDTDSTILAMQVLGLALAGTGAYEEAAGIFGESARFGREYGIGPFLARSIAMSAGFHLDVFDFEGHLAGVDEACEVARSVNFVPPLISATIDKMLNLARRGDVGGAERLESEVASAVERAGSWHAWLWALRMAQTHAEIALARGDADSAIDLASASLDHASGRRPKYEVLALITRAAALSRLGRTSAAIADLEHAVAQARGVADPALFVRATSALLSLDGNDGRAREARGAAASILAHLPLPSMRERFLAAEPVQAIGPLDALVG